LTAAPTPAPRSRIRRGLAVAWSIAFLVAAFVLAGIASFLLALVITGSPEAVTRWLPQAGAGPLMVQGIAALLVAIPLTWLIGVRIGRLDWADLRYERGSRAVTGFGGGLGIGALAAGAALLLAVLLGDAEWVADGGGIGAYGMRVLGTLAVLAPAALAEEVLFRGVPLVLLAAAFGRVPALVALSALFGLAHLYNPNVTALGVVNIMAAGIFLGLAFYAPGGIWTAFGAHLGWNGTLAALDAPVSGLPFQIPMIDYAPGGPQWLTGGAFGPEGGLTATVAIALASALTARRLEGRRA
jgi:membrane protease YdiL (CAAX protease family)